jgi:ABC-type cobalamin/Fe3+-siderophores transport system ATPase subunit
VNPSPLLKVSALSVTQKGAQLLRDVSLSLCAGECLAVVGPNGAGKTTLLRAVAGLLSPSAGSVSIDGEEASRMTPERRMQMVGLVPQRLAHIPPFTVREFLELSGLARGEESLSLVKHLEDRLLPELSGGELQRALIAGAVAQGATLLLLDEPTASLDPVGRKQVEEVLCACRESMKVSYIMVTHDVSLAARAADSVAIMRDGAIAWIGLPQEPELVRQLSDAYGCHFVRLGHECLSVPLVVPV